MKHKWMFVLAAAVILSGCGKEEEMKDVQVPEASKAYGEPLELKETVKVSALLNSPDDYIGKKVQVEGEILDVCKMRGCWIEIAGDEPYQKIKVKVDDGVIVFPMDAKGKKVRAEGELQKIELTVEQARKHMQHRAEEYGEKFDPASVTEPMVYYQIKGTGAVVMN